MANAQGLGQGVAAQSMGASATPVGQQFAQPSQMSGGLGNQFQMTPPQNGTLQMPQSMQRTPGGFGLSPQMLQMIARLQQRTPQFTPGQVPPKFGAWGGGGQGFTPAQNPYAQSPQNWINASGGTMGR